MPTEEPKLCKDCKWYGGEQSFQTCQSPYVPHNVNVVTGMLMDAFCNTQRESILVNCCGRDAQFFEPREAE